MHLRGMGDDMMTPARTADADVRPFGLEPLLSVSDLAEYLGVPQQTIYDWRVHGRGPRASKVGKRLRFAASDVRAWLQRQADPVADGRG